MKEIEFSVVILVYQKAYEMDLLLMGFHCQDYPMDQVEFIVVDDGSTDGLASVLAKYSGNLNIHHLENPHTGNRGHNRNLGIGMASGRRILFFDGDQIPERDFLARHDANTRGDVMAVSMASRKKLLDFERSCVTAETVRDNFGIIREFPAISDERTSAGRLMREAGLRCRQAWNMVFSHNICLHRETLEKIGGFDKDFSANWGVEDVELGYRLHLAGARILYDESIRCYHVNHPENMAAKIRQLRANLDLFFRKHPNWEAELYAHEHKVWPIKYLAVRERIHAGDHLLGSAGDASGMREKIGSRKAIGIGIACPAVRGLVLETVATRTGSMGKATDLNLIGSRLPFADAYFDLALVSARYSVLGPGLLELVLREAARVASRVAFVSETGWEGEWNPNPEAPAPAVRKAIKPVILSVTDADINCYGINAMHHLGLALQGRGYAVETRHAYNPFGERDPFGHFFSLSGAEKRRRVAETTTSNLGFVDDIAPNLMDASLPMHAARSLGNKHLWHEPTYRNYHAVFKEMDLGSADRVLLRRTEVKGERAVYRPTAALPMGIDRAMVDALGTPADGIRGVRFLIACKSLSPSYDLESAVAAFLKAAGGRTDLRLDILAGAPRSPVPSPFLNDALFRYIEERHAYSGFKSDRIRRNLGEILRGDTRVALHEGNPDEAEVLRRLRDSDGLIDLNPAGETNPLVLYALAMGKKPLILDRDVYAGYVDPDDCILVGSQDVPAAQDGPGIRSPYRSAKDWDHHYLMRKPDPASLEAAIAAIAGDKRLLIASPQAKRSLAADFTWDAIAGRFHEALK